MKTIEIDDELYQYIATNTQHIGESASSILRRLLSFPSQGVPVPDSQVAQAPQAIKDAVSEAPVVVANVPEQPKHREEPAKPAAVVAPVRAVDTPAASPTELSQVLQSIAQNQQKAAVRRFLSLLGALYELHPEHFSQVLEIRGRNRLYFALSEEELLASGRSTNPMSVPGSPYWVIGNTNTERKREILNQVLKRLGYSEAQQAEACELL